jgi:hypothetical protein
MSAAATRTKPEETFAVLPGTNGDGTPIFSVLVKRTYDLRPGVGVVRAEKARPFVLADVYYDGGDAETSTVQYETDQVAYKPATDVVLIGKAYAPAGKPAARIVVALEVASRKKSIRVLGDRLCRYRPNLSPAFTDPVPFTEMELRYDRAYGGKDLRSMPDVEFYYPRNTMGKGLALRNVREVIEGLALPNLEDPGDLLTPERVVLGEPERWNRQPLPQGLGWFQKTWYPRCSFAGAVPGFVNLDEPMREEALGLVPPGQVALARQFKLPGFDVRFCNGASPGLVFPYLRGGEAVTLTNLTPDGELRFTLPKDQPRVRLDIGLGDNELQPMLQTVCLHVEDMQLDVLWQATHEYPGTDWLPEMKRLHAVVT